MHILWPPIQIHTTKANTHTTTIIKIQIVEIHNHKFAFFIVKIEDLKTFENNYIS
jgi:hypothetical protein